MKKTRSAQTVFHLLPARKSQRILSFLSLTFKLNFITAFYFLSKFTAMKILTISGSSRNDSSNSKLLDAIPFLISKYTFERYSIAELPLFRPELEQSNLPEKVKNWRSKVQLADAVIFATPEYIHNIPALLKNALEWLTTSGELHHKPVLPITFTPHEPRGEKAMQSLLWSLQALDARVIAQLPLYQNEIQFDKEGKIIEGENSEMLKEAIGMF